MSKDCVWSPHHQELIKKIEKVQMRATKLLSRTRNLKHEEHLKILNLPTLKYRTVRGDMTELYNIITCKQDELRRYRPQIISATHTTFVIIQLQSQATVKKSFFVSRSTTVSHPPHQILAKPLRTGLPGLLILRKRDALCGRYGVADIDFAYDRYGVLCGRHRLWPISSFPNKAML